MNGNIMLNRIMNNNIPELIIDKSDIINAGFTPGAVFKIQPYRNGLIITLIASEIATQQILNEIENDHHIGMDWIQDNGELSLSGEWLTQTGLTGQPLEINVMAGKVVIRGQLGNMLV
ncbi:HSP20-like protein [Yersinia pseudotuberculosis]|uniref:SymE family type I addiction module toxin n=1 Tax=Yersinia pseudotuberculosis TaxID=633 RepID=UPI0005DE5B35|nr:SymE family type I addiction module toxin [Yersinia pseudotuberculosis]CNL69829.1 HSP20-like protein [Yersinia pseudotuberculosis]